LKEEGPVVAPSPSSSLKLPDGLPNMEDVLKELSVALTAFKTPSRDKFEMLWLRGIISGVKINEEIFSDYLYYCGLEEGLIELRENAGALVKKPQANART
jgi:hypothetical protein